MKGQNLSVTIVESHIRLRQLFNWNATKHVKHQKKSSHHKQHDNHEDAEKDETSEDSPSEDTDLDVSVDYDENLIGVTMSLSSLWETTHSSITI